MLLETTAHLHILVSRDMFEYNFLVLQWGFFTVTITLIKPSGNDSVF